MKKYILITLLVIAIVFIYTKLKMSRDNPEILNPLLDHIEINIQFRDMKRNSISKVDVAWHLDHILKTINEISKDLEASDPKTYESSTNVSKIASLTAGFIPRGRAQSPSRVLPPSTIKTEDLYQQIELAKTNILKLKTLDDHANFDHPVFGVLDKGQAIRFLEVHTEHHLKIVEDILK